MEKNKQFCGEMVFGRFLMVYLAFLTETWDNLSQECRTKYFQFIYRDPELELTEDYLYGFRAFIQDFFGDIVGMYAQHSRTYKASFIPRPLDVSLVRRFWYFQFNALRSGRDFYRVQIVKPDLPWPRIPVRCEVEAYFRPDGFLQRSVSWPVLVQKDHDAGLVLDIFDIYRRFKDPLDPASSRLVILGPCICDLFDETVNDLAVPR